MKEGQEEGRHYKWELAKLMDYGQLLWAHLNKLSLTLKDLWRNLRVGLCACRAEVPLNLLAGKTR